MSKKKKKKHKKRKLRRLKQLQALEQRALKEEAPKKVPQKPSLEEEKPSVEIVPEKEEISSSSVNIFKKDLKRIFVMIGICLLLLIGCGLVIHFNLVNLSWFNSLFNR